MEIENLGKLLSSLRRLYFNLDEYLNNKLRASDIEILSTLIHIEAKRRLSNFIGKYSDLNFLYDFCDNRIKDLQISKALPKPLILPLADLQFIQDQMQKNINVLDYFDECIFGYFYQFMSDPERKLALKEVQKANKSTSHKNLIRFTQIYTPQWVSDYLLSNTLIPLWKNWPTQIFQSVNTTKTATIDSLELYKSYLFLPENLRNHLNSQDYEHLFAESDISNTTKLASELRLLDPACGAGHILTRAMDLFIHLHLLENRTMEEAIIRTCSENIYGVDIDSTALWISAFALSIKSLKYLKKEVDLKLNFESLEINEYNKSSLSGENLLGTLDRNSQSKILNSSFDAIVSNPPYLGRKLLDRRLKQFLKVEYSSSQQDLSAAFLERAFELANQSGRIGFITQSSLLYLPSFSELRKFIIEQNALESVIELGTKTFPLISGEKVTSVLIMLCKNNYTESCLQNTKQNKEKSIYLDLSNSSEKQKDLISSLNAYKQTTKQILHRDLKDFLNQRAFSFNFSVSNSLSYLLNNSKTLTEIASVKQGLATGNNKRFLRYWWEVLAEDIGIRYFPYVKGAGSQPWHNPVEMVIDWGKEGKDIKESVANSYPYLKGKTNWVIKNESYFFKTGLSFSFVNKGHFAVRELESGSIFDVGGSAIFCEPKNLYFLLAYLNSSFVAYCMSILSPTLNTQIGDIKRIPILEFDNIEKEEFSCIAQNCVQITRQLFKYQETNRRSKEFLIELLDPILDGQDPEEALKKIFSKQMSLFNELSTEEEKIENKVWKKLHQTKLLTTQELNDLSSNIKNTLSLIQNSAEKRKNKNLISEKKLGMLILNRLIERIFLSKPNKHNIAIDSIELRNMFSQNTICWIEKIFDNTLENTLLYEFNQNQNQIFHKKPRQIISKDFNNKLFIVDPNTNEQKSTATTNA